VPRGVHQVFADSLGTLWVITHQGLYAIPPGVQRKPVHDGDPVLSGVKVKVITEAPDGSLWLGTSDGLFHRVRGRWHRLQLHNADVGNTISSVAAGPAGEVWIAGEFDGVARLRVDSDTVGVVQIYTVPILSSESVNGIVVDSRGWVWIASDRGVDTLQSGHWRHFDRDEGLLWNDTNEGAMLIDRDGSAWIGTSAGLSHLIHPETPSGIHPLTTRIEEASWGGHPLALDKPSSLPWQSGNLIVNFAVISYRNENAVSFRYRLVGLEEDWESTRDHSVRYSKLPSGHYRFEVVSEDSGLHRVSPPAVLSFDVKPPWWMTPTAWVLGVIGVLVLGALFLRWRLNRLLEMQKRLEKQVAERTHALQAERRELLATREVLRQQATRDGLTGLLNRTAILEVLDREWKRAEREKNGLAVIIADVDHFKRFNDTFGHIAGDEVLRAIAGRLKEGVRDYDSVGRYGGEEFLIVLMGWNREGGEDRLTHLWRSVCANPLRIGGRILRATSSFGVAGFSAGEEAVPFNDLLISADQALYRAKARGRNRIEFAGHAEDENEPFSQSPAVE
jgi:diguanylate cyclase (GGDEF)-like protein